jgi:hypothetical protein
MRQCWALTNDFRRCRNSAQAGQWFCHKHRWWFIVTLITGFASIIFFLESLTGLIANVGIPLFPKITSTSLPRASNLYFAFIVDASGRMSESFDGDKTKWDSVREAALDNLILGLPARANYGLILLGGNPTGNVTNCDAVNMVLPLGEDNRDQIGRLIEDQKPQGVSSLTKAIDLARNNLLSLSDDSSVRALELWVFLGGGDGCSNNDLKPILYFVQGSAKFLTNTHMDLFILSNEVIDRDMLNEIEESDQATGNVTVNLTTNNAELAAAVNQSYEEAKERARRVEPTAVAAQETIVVQTPFETERVAINVSSITAIAGYSTPKPTWTPSPVVMLESVSYLAIGESCSARINLHVRGSPATGNFHVWNSSYGPEGDIYPVITLLPGPNAYEVILRGHGDPGYYRHKVWFVYNGISSNVLDNLICPELTLTPSP